jgi:hypothetical protein
MERTLEGIRDGVHELVVLARRGGGAPPGGSA